MIKCVINTIEYELTDKFSIKEKLGNVISTNMEILVPLGTRVPRAGDIVRIMDTSDNTVYFIGVAGIPTSPKYSNPNQVRLYKIKCLNANAILKRRQVNYAVNDATTTEIVNQLFTQYIMPEGITKGVVSNVDVNFDVYVAPNLDLQKVLNELAERSDAVWNITNDYVFNFIKQEDFDQFSDQINNDYLFGNNLQHKTSAIDLRTVQIIESLEETDVQTENFAYNGTDNDFAVSFPLVRKPTIQKNGVDVASERIGVKGLDSNNDEIYFLFANNSPIVTYNPTSNFLASGDTITINYVGSFPIRVEAFNQSRIDEISQATGTSGIIENVVTDNTIKNIDDAETLAQNLLENFEFERDDVFWTLYDPQLKDFGLTINSFPIGIEIDFNLPDFDLVGKFVVVERTITPFSANDVVNNLTCKLKLQNRNLLRSYGQTFNLLERKLASISIREDEIIINTLRIQEQIAMSEQIDFEIVTPYFPTAVGSPNILDPGWFAGNEGAFPV